MGIQKTTANAISRKLKTVGFEKRRTSFDYHDNAEYEFGFECFFDKHDFKSIIVINKHFGETNEVAFELAQMGYSVMDYSPYVTVVYGKEVANV